MQCGTCGRRYRGGCPQHGASPARQLDAAVAEFPGYRVVRAIGYGGFGAVYLAEGGDGEVAIKIAHQGAQGDARLRREATALAMIGPPHVPRLFHAGDLPGGAFHVVMELVPWRTLGALLDERQRLGVDEAVNLARGILRALAAAHDLGLVHRDLKPENMFVPPDGQSVKLVDFGLVKQVGVAPSGEALTATGGIIGSTAYMSPEQSAGRPDLDPRSDLYSVGVILYEALAGRPPFLGSSAEVLHAHIGRRPPRLSTLVDVPPRLEEIVHRCLAKHPDDRPATSRELLEALASVQQTSVAPAVRAPVAAPAAGASRERAVVGALFFRSDRPATTVQGRMASFAGAIARAEGGYVAVFDHEAGDNPVRRALAAGQAVVGEGLAEGAVVDTLQVIVLPRPDGTRRYISPQFKNEASFPAPSDPPGVQLTVAAGELVGDVATVEIPGSERTLVVRHASQSSSGASAELYGRDDLLAAVVDACREAADGKPTIVTLSGGPGSGKTSLLATAAARLRRALPALEIIALGVAEPVGWGSGAALRELARIVLDLPERRSSDGGRALLAERFGFALGAELWPGVAVAMGWADAADADVRAVAAAPGALGSSAARAVGLGLRQRAADRPLVVLIDDAHHADALALDALELATLEEGGARLLVAVSARPAFDAARPEWGLRAAKRLHLDIPPLEGEPAAAMCRHLLAPAENIPDATLDRLIARTQGVPLLIVELCRGLKREGMLRRHEKGEGWYLASDALDAVPNLPLVEWLASRELSDLDPELARHARLLSRLGPEVSLAEVAGVLAELDRAGLGAEFPLDARVAARKLVNDGMLVEHGDRLAFRSGVVREAVERSTPLNLAQPIHEAAWRFFSTTRDPDALPALAYHAAGSGRQQEALAAYLEIARRAEARHAYLEAELHYGRAVELAGDADVRALLRGRGLMRYRLGRYDEALVDMKRAQDLAAAHGDVALEIDLHLDMATVLDWLDEYHASSRHVERAAELAATLPPDELTEARLDMGRGRTAHRFARFEEAVTLLAAARARAEPLGHAGYETFLISSSVCAFDLSTLGRVDESEAIFTRILALVAERGDTMHLGGILGNRAALWTAKNDPERIIGDLRQVLECARSIGNPRLEYGSRQLLALALHQTGRSAEAELQARLAVEIDDRRNGANARVESRLYLARILAVRGDREAASAVLAEVDSRYQDAKRRGAGAGELMPIEELTWRLVALLVDGGTHEAWADVETRARACLTGADLDEVLALAARARARAS